MPGQHDRSHLGELRELLLADRARHLARIEALNRNVTLIDDATQLTATDDEHDPEGATIAFERSQASTLLASARQQLTEVDQALTRLDAAGYGTCEQCGRPIAVDRLRARPVTRTCIACASASR